MRSLLVFAMLVGVGGFPGVTALPDPCEETVTPLGGPALCFDAQSNTGFGFGPTHEPEPNPDYDPLDTQDQLVAWQTWILLVDQQGNSMTLPWIHLEGDDACDTWLFTTHECAENPILPAQPLYLVAYDGGDATLPGAEIAPRQCLYEGEIYSDPNDSFPPELGPYPAFYFLDC